MSTLGERLKKARISKGFTQVSLAKAIGGYQSKYQSWESDTYEPDTETLKKLARILDVTVEWLIEGTQPLGVNESGIEYAAAPHIGAPLISWDVLRRLHVPITHVPAEESEGPPVPTYCRDPHCFALRVKGDTMEPEFVEGDIIVVSPAAVPHSGSYVVAKYDGQVVMSQLKIYSDSLVLRPLNSKYEEVLFASTKKNKVKIIGTIVEKIKRY